MYFYLNHQYAGNMRIRVLSFLIANLMIHGLLSQPKQKFHDHFDIYSTKNGLSQNDVRCVFQDSYGFIWIGTHGGLNRFDGYTFKVFQKEIGNKYSLSSNLISSLAEDKDGNIWIGTDDAGAMMMDRSTGKITQLHNSNRNPSLLTHNHVVCIQVDASNQIWVGTTDGLNRITKIPDSDQFKIQKIKASTENPLTISHNYITDIFEDRLGNLWFGTVNGLNRYIKTSNDSTYQFIYYDSDSQARIRSISSNDTSLLVATVFDLKALPYAQINRNNPTFHPIRVVTFSEISADRQGNIWGVNLNGAQVVYRNNDIRTKFYTNKVRDEHSLSKDFATTVMCDNNSMIWIGTNGGGLNLYNPFRKNFMHYLKTFQDGSLSYNKIRAILEDDSGNLWIGTEGGGLNFLSTSKKGQFQHGWTYVSNVQEGGKYVYCLEQADFGHQKRMFVGVGHNSFINEVTFTESGKPEMHRLEGIDTEGPVFSMYFDNNKVLWLGTYANGLFRVTFDEYGDISDIDHLSHHPTHYIGLSSNVIRSIAEDHDGNLWIGTDNGLNKLSQKEKYKESPVFIRYQYDPDDLSSISYDYIIPIYVAQNGDIWVGTLGGGLNKIIPGTTPNNDRFKRYSTDDGLPDNHVKSIEQDGDGSLWLATNKGLSKFDPDQEQFINFGLSDGLQDLEFSEIASVKLKNGDMLFGGVNGFNYFTPSEIIADTSEVRIVFTEFQLLNKSIQAGEKINGRVLLENDLNELDELKLYHTENSFSVSFAALHYAAPEKNQYSFMLEGFDKHWIRTESNNRIAKYTNLSPGEYLLKVRASNSDGFWNPNPVTLPIHIAPPFWLTNYAIAAYVVVFGLGLWFFRKYTIIASSRKNQLLIEHLEKEKIEELSQLKLRFFTNISHEFRTPLTLIIGLIERLKQSGKDFAQEDLSNYYNKIHRNSQVLLNLINQLLDFRKVEQGMMKVKVAKGNLSEYIGSLCDNFKELARRKEIDFHYESEEDLIGYFDQEILERIMFNLLSNAFKFTTEHGEITVYLSRSENDQYVELSIKDNGIGMSKQVQDHMFERFSDKYVKKEHGSGIGLSYTKGLVELYHGRISFNSEENVGTTFYLELPIDKGAFAHDIISDESPEISEVKKDVNWLIDTGDRVPQNGHHLGNQSRQQDTILLVEDNDDILFYLKEQLKSYHNIITASDGAEALELCLSNHIDLVVSDIMMPVMDGMEFCEKLKADDRINHILVILLTAKSSTESKVTSYEKGADAYITKPFEMRELETRIEALLSTRKRLLKKLRKGVDLSPSAIEVTSLDEKFLKRVLSYIEENIGHTEFTVEMLAHEVGMSQLHLNKKLKVLVGQTANAFIRNIRLKRAAQLLAKNRYSVNEVMYEVGFIDAKYFRTCFKKEFGITPSDYQRQHADV